MPRYIVQMRRGGKTQWEESNIIPLAGELVVEIDEENNLHKLKIGDGIHTYSELAYLQSGDNINTSNDDMPTIRLGSTRDTDGTMIISENNPLTLVVEITHGALQIGDQIQLCTRKLSTYNEGAQRKYKLRAFANYVITEEDLNKTQFFITVSTDKEIHEMLRGGGDESEQSTHNYYPKYLRIRRGIKLDDGNEYTAKFSNIEQFQVFGRYDKDNCCSKGKISIR